MSAVRLYAASKPNSIRLMASVSLTNALPFVQYVCVGSNAFSRYRSHAPSRCLLDFAPASRSLGLLTALRSLRSLDDMALPSPSSTL